MTRIRLGAALAAVAAIGLLLAAPLGGAQIGERTLDTGDYGGIGSTNSFCWRGYTFSVATPVYLTALHGGHSGTGTTTYHVGLYTAPALDMTGQAADELLASAELPGGERFARVEIEPVLLLPGQVYLVAQGREVGIGSHYVLAGDIDTEALVTGELHVLEWGPSDGRSYTFSCTGGPERPLETNASTFTSTVRPHLGFGDLFPSL